MADETLSLRAEFEDIGKLQSDLAAAHESILALGESATTATQGFIKLTQAANAASSAAGNLGKQRTGIDVDGLHAAAQAAAEARAKIASFGQGTKKAADDSKKATQGMAQDFAGVAARIGLLPPAIQGVVGAFAGLGIARSVELVFTSIKNTATSLVKEFTEMEDATTAFAVSLGAIGQFSDKAVADMTRLAESIQNTSSYMDEAVISAAALIAQVSGLSGTTLNKATQAAVDLSTVLGRDLHQAALLVGRAAQGATDYVARFGLVLDESLPKAKRFTDVLAQIEEKFGGTAALRTRTLAGQIQILRAHIDDLKESAASFLAVFEPGLRILNEQMRTFVNLLEARGFIVKPAQNLDAAFEHLVGTLNEVRDGARNAGNSITEFLAGENRGILDRILRGAGGGRGGFKDLARQLQDDLGQIDLTAHVSLRGDPEQIRTVIRQLEQGIAFAKVRGLPQDFINQLEKLQQFARKALVIKIEADTHAAVIEIKNLQKHLNDLRPGLHVEDLFSHDLDILLKRLELFQPEIQAKLKLDPKVQAQVDTFKATLRILPELDRSAFQSFVTEVLDFIGELEEREISGSKEVSDKARATLLAMKPVLIELRKQSSRLFDEEAAERATKKWKADFEAFQKSFPEIDFSQLGKAGPPLAGESRLADFLGLLQDIQQQAGIPIEVRLQAEDFIREADDSTRAAEYLQEAVDAILATRDLSQIDALSERIAKYRFEAAKAGFESTELTKTLDDMQAQLRSAQSGFGPLFQARTIQARIEVLLDQGQVDEAKGELARLEQLLVEFPQLRLAINLEDVQASFLAIDQIRKNFDQAMQGVDAAIQITTGLITSGFQNAADQILNIFVSLFADILRKLIASKILSFLTRFTSPGGIAGAALEGLFHMKPTGAIPPIPEPAPVEPPAAPKVTLEPIRIPAPDVAVEPLRIPAPTVLLEPFTVPDPKDIEVAAAAVTVTMPEPNLIVPGALRIPAQEIDVAAAQVRVPAADLILPDDLTVPAQKIEVAAAYVTVPPPEVKLPDALDVQSAPVVVTSPPVTVLNPVVVLPAALRVPAQEVDVARAIVTVPQAIVSTPPPLEIAPPQVTIAAQEITVPAPDLVLQAFRAPAPQELEIAAAVVTIPDPTLRLPGALVIPSQQVEVAQASVTVPTPALTLPGELEIPAQKVDVAAALVTVPAPTVDLPGPLELPAQDVQVAGASVTVLDPVLHLPRALEIPAQEIEAAAASVTVPEPRLVLPPPLEIPGQEIDVAAQLVTVPAPRLILPDAIEIPAQQITAAAASVTVQDPFLILPDAIEVPGQKVLVGQTSVKVPPPALILPEAIEIAAPTVDVTRASLTIPAPEVILPDPLVVPVPAVDLLAASVTVEQPKIVQGDAISVEGPQVTLRTPAPLIVPPRPTRIEAPVVRVAAIADRFKLPKLELPEFDIPTIPVDITLPELPALRARIAALPTVFDEPIAIQQPRELLPVVQFARFAEREAAAARTVVLPAPSPRPEPESILRRRTAPDVQVTFAGNFDGESVRRQLQSGSMNREFNRMARRGRL